MDTLKGTQKKFTLTQSIVNRLKCSDPKQFILQSVFRGFGLPTGFGPHGGHGPGKRVGK